jgi:hypothetical protein
MKIRAAAHVHSDWSYDGSWSLSRISSCFKGAGYNCVFTSEHDKSFNQDRWQSYRKACVENSADDFLIVPGIEYSDRLNIVHVLVWGNIPFLGSERETEELLQEVTKFKGIAVLAHPSRKQAWQEYKSQWGSFLSGIEQWNRKVDGVAPSQEALSLLKQNPRLMSFVGLDFHRANQLFPLYMTFQINGRLDEEHVLEELREGKCRAKVAGVSIEYLSRGTLHKAVKGIEQFRQFLRRMIKEKQDIRNKNQTDA